MHFNDVSVNSNDIGRSHKTNKNKILILMSNIGINHLASTPDIETDRMRLNLLVLKDHMISSSEDPTLRALIQGLRAYPYEEMLNMTQQHPVT